MIAPARNLVPAWAYARVSSDRQYESTLGIRGYIGDAIRFADAYGYDLGADTTLVVLDEEGREQKIPARERVVADSASAYKKRFCQRAGGRLLSQNVKPGHHVIIPQMTRGFRNIIDCLETVGRWEKIGVVTHILDSPVQGQAMLGFFAAIAQWESEVKSRRMKDAHQQARSLGRLIANCRPDPGFTVTVVGGKRYQVPCPEELALIGKVGAWMRQGLGEQRILAKVRALALAGEPVRAATNRQVRHLMAAAKHVEAIERLTGKPAAEADDEWLRAFQEAHVARQELEREKQRERKQRKAYREYQQAVGA